MIALVRLVRTAATDSSVRSSVTGSTSARRGVRRRELLLEARDDRTTCELARRDDVRVCALEVVGDARVQPRQVKERHFER